MDDDETARKAKLLAAKKKVNVKTCFNRDRNAT
jgi:hypothetical protein